VQAISLHPNFLSGIRPAIFIQPATAHHCPVDSMRMLGKP
jgi:hypothetical protein